MNNKDYILQQQDFLIESLVELLIKVFKANLSYDSKSHELNVADHNNKLTATYIMDNIDIKDLLSLAAFIRGGLVNG